MDKNKVAKTIHKLYISHCRYQNRTRSILRLGDNGMSKKEIKTLVIVSVVPILVIVLPLLVYYAVIFPHGIFIDRDMVKETYALDLTDDVKLVSCRDESFLCVIDCNLIVEVDDAGSFLKNNIKADIEKNCQYDYKYSVDTTGTVYVRTEPYEDKFRVHLQYVD